MISGRGEMSSEIEEKGSANEGPSLAAEPGETGVTPSPSDQAI